MIGKINTDKIDELVYFINQQKYKNLTFLRFDYTVEFLPTPRLDFFAYIDGTPFWQKASEYFKNYMTGYMIAEGVFWRDIPFCLDEQVVFNEFKNFLLLWSRMVAKEVIEGNSVPLNVKAIRKKRSLCL